MIWLNEHEHGHQIGDQLGRGFRPPYDQVISVTREGKLIGGVLLQEYTGTSINLHVASQSPTWLTRNFLWVLFTHCFVELDCRKIFGFVWESNKHALAFDEKIGFHYEGKLLDAVPTGDIVILSMYRESCRWLKVRPRSLEADLKKGSGYVRRQRAFGA